MAPCGAGKGSAERRKLFSAAEHLLRRITAALERVSKEISGMQKLEMQAARSKRPAAHWPCVAQ
jgi:hypothetical protein